MKPKTFSPMHYADVVTINRAIVGSHVVIADRHYIVIGYANNNSNNLVLRRKFGCKIFLAVRSGFDIVSMQEVK